ncbi:T9SS type A sorting domain-containing protein [Hymenobacter sp. 15J16-1T3B]|uniref:T9SS type A sorting domain-containing protein n=1 Tax=Hymenobacter sp. 15J16-1T3B TaxID=2886941 RepID=UPI001D107161|nr:T9SS type A sorting domain-containing protein [Hymenobacter sp. 15J16-1T3B]MCC3158502.1 T9SS type A sorting domain-containing protein [Hymenobacter sp. 15J16-1T3B]
MRQLLLVIPLLLASLGAQAQRNAAWAPGSRWTYFTFVQGPRLGDLRLEYVGDTTIQGRPCQKLRRQLKFHSRSTADSYPPLYTSADANAVWIYEGGQFLKLYDFSVGPGDSWTTPIVVGGILPACSYSARVTVDSVGQQFVAGRLRRWFRASYTLTPAVSGHVVQRWGRVYEGLGPINSFLLVSGSGYFGCDGSDPPLTGALLCYSAGAQNLYTNAQYTDCTTLVTASAPAARPAALGVSPNPSTGLLMLPPGILAGTVQVHDLAGRLAWQGPLPVGQPIDLRALPKGLYLIRVQPVQGAPLLQRVLLQ